MTCPVCDDPIPEHHIANDGETLLVLVTPDGPAHMRCCVDRCRSCHKLVKARERHGTWAFSYCGCIWIPVVSEPSLDAAPAFV